MVMFKRLCVFVVVLCNFLRCVYNSGVGPCPKLRYMPNFELYKFAGHWYEIERSFYLMEIISSCVSVDLTATSRDQLQVSINTRSRWSENFSISEGIATQTKKDPSVLLYRVSSKLPRAINRYLPGSGFYQVLKTDYNNYAVLYSCTNYQVVHTDLVWIWGRRQEIHAELRAEIYDMLTEHHIDSERLILPKNKNCTEY